MASSRRPRNPEGAKVALVEAAARLLTEQAPNTITGRDLAAEAGVNYGLVHHYFGGRDALLAAGMDALRDDFTTKHGNGATVRFLGAESHPYLKAIVRSQVDYPNSVLPASGGFPIGLSMSAAVAERLAARNGARSVAQAQARTITAIALQVCYGVFGAALLDATGVRPWQVPAVERQLAKLYDELILAEGDQ